MKTSVVVAAFLLGAALTAATVHAQLVPEIQPKPAQRSYLCFEGNSAAEVTRKANEAGARGWRMTSAALSSNGSIWCFEQLSAARPDNK